jgi:hypothetical protein
MYNWMSGVGASVQWLAPRAPRRSAPCIRAYAAVGVAPHGVLSRAGSRSSSRAAARRGRVAQTRQGTNRDPQIARADSAALLRGPVVPVAALGAAAWRRRPRRPRSRRGRARRRFVVSLSFILDVPYLARGALCAASLARPASRRGARPLHVSSACSSVRSCLRRQVMVLSFRVTA